MGRFKRNLLILLLILLPAALVAYSMGTERDSWFLPRLASRITDPVIRLISSAADGVSRVWNGYFWLSGKSLENIGLRRELEELKALSARTDEVERENTRLLALLGYHKARPDLDMRLAHVVASGMSTKSDLITIDLGSSDGVKKGFAVVSIDGLVGRVYKVFPGHSEVLLITDRSSSIAAIVQSSRARAYVKGRGSVRSRTCDLEYIPRSEAVSDGDTVVTAGMGESFPKGIIIGRVTGVDRTANTLFQNAEVDPSVDFSKLEEVLVVFNAGGGAGSGMK